MTVFRAYDIRGIYEKEIDGEFAKNLGKAYCSYMNEKEVYVGRDVRTSSFPLFEKLAEGITESGSDVIDLGIIPSPVHYFAMRINEKNAGIMITASHNPPEYNGFKLGRGKYAFETRSPLTTISPVSPRGTTKSSDQFSMGESDILINRTMVLLMDRPIQFPKPCSLNSFVSNSISLLAMEVTGSASTMPYGVCTSASSVSI